MQCIQKITAVAGLLLLSACAGKKETPISTLPMTTPQAYTEPEERMANPGSLFNLAENTELYADNRARQVGDIVMIKVVENSKSKSKADTNASRDTEMKIGVTSAFGESSVGPLWSAGNVLNGDVGKNPLLAASYGSSLKGTGETKRENFVTATIGARVLQVLPNGVLQVQGARKIRVNEETQYMVITGLVRSRDIAADNSVESTQMADSEVEYYGEGVLADKQRAGWLSRLLDIIWPL